MAFHVGQKVVCVKGFAGNDKLPPLVEGNIYVIDGIQFGNYLGPYLLDANQVGLLLSGVDHPSYPWVEGAHETYDSGRFRPLQEQGMSILRAIAANPKRELEVA